MLGEIYTVSLLRGLRALSKVSSSAQGDHTGEHTKPRISYVYIDGDDF